MIKHSMYCVWMNLIGELLPRLQVTKCAAAGRDHLPCCLRRGVPVECQALCQGTQTHSENSVFGDCFAYIGNIMTCLEDGKPLMILWIIFVAFNESSISIIYIALHQFKLDVPLLGWIDLPAPVKNFHATYVQDSKISLAWDPVMIKGM